MCLGAYSLHKANKRKVCHKNKKRINCSAIPETALIQMSKNGMSGMVTTP